jgi:Uma2 family endonuclease
MQTSVSENVRPLRRVEYDKLVDLGVFEDERLELLEGALVYMSPIGPRHCSAVQKLNELLVTALAGRATVRPQLPLAASDLSEPEPDLLVAARDDYDMAHPSHAYLVIEVAESSLAKDRGIKQRIYAQNGVPEYWVVDVVARTIEVYSQPSSGAYARMVQYARGDSITLGAFPDVCIRVIDIMR